MNGLIFWKSFDRMWQKQTEPITWECGLPIGYRLCVLASGSLITSIFIFRTLISVSCLHLGQYNGKFSSTVSSLIFNLVLLPHNGHNSHSLSCITSIPSYSSSCQVSHSFSHFIKKRTDLLILVPIFHKDYPGKLLLLFLSYSRLWFFQQIIHCPC